MTLRQLLTRVAFLGIAIIGITVAVVVASSSDQTAAIEVPAADEEVAVESVFDEIFDETVFAGSFNGSSSFTVVGEVVISADDLGQRTLRLSEDFRTNRGPELVINLRTSDGELWSPGALQSPGGSQVFEIPGQIDLTEFNEVQIFDEQLSVVFGTAAISPI